MFAHSGLTIRLGATFMWYWEMWQKENNADKSVMSDFGGIFKLLRHWLSPYLECFRSVVAPFLDSGFGVWIMEVKQLLIL
jgi:hypothetical protein